jgi:hypothetical protein
MATDSTEVDPDEVDPDEVDEVDADAGDATDEVTYELNEWSREARGMLDQLLVGADVRHAWIGTDLLVGPDDEGLVDDLVEQVRSTDSPMLDPDAEKVVYEVADWDPAELYDLIGVLADQGVGYEFDVHGDLVVLATHEAEVDKILDDLDQTSDGDDDEADDDSWSGDGGLEANDLLSDLYLAADRLQKSATDHAGVLGAVAAAEALAGKPVPFGFDEPMWSRIQQRAARLRDGLEGDEDDDDELMQQARELRELLAPLI